MRDNHNKNFITLEKGINSEMLTSTWTSGRISLESNIREGSGSVHDIVFYYPEGHQAHFENGHPERPERVEVIREAFISEGWWEKYPKLDPADIPEKNLERIHTKEYLKSLSDDVHLQVFVTPTCPYCPPMVMLAHQMAFENSFVRGDMVEATEFPHLGQKYNVRGVPRTIINETESVEGRVPEEMLVSQIKLALYKSKNKS